MGKKKTEKRKIYYAKETAPRIFLDLDVQHCFNDEEKTDQ